MGLDADLQRTTRFAKLVRVLSCDSTQALSTADDDATAAVFWSDHQTAGRGRQGRSWLDEPALDVAVTLRLTNVALPNPTRLAAAIPVAVVRALAPDVPEARIKWPNDVLLGGRKLCGVLIDSEGQPPARHHVGVGINVNRTSFPEELREQSTSLALATGREFDREEIVLRVAREVSVAVDQLLAGEFAPLAEDFATRLGLIGQPVEATSGETTHRGTLTAIDLDRLVLDRVNNIPLAHLRRLSPSS